MLGASLGEIGECQEAFPYLKEGMPKGASDKLKRAVGTDAVKCAMDLNREDDALENLRRLRREFSRDPEVLYFSVHVLSDLSTRSAQELLNISPSSSQVHLLNAEALESQNRWDEAAEEYRRILAQDPNQPGIHYRLGRLILSKPKTATTLEDAKAEFEAELKIDPRNAGAEYVLGELARQSQDWSGAAEHFARAAKYDPHFADAMIELGRTLLSAGRPADAVAPLEQAVKLQPENPTAHYQLATAYRSVGRREEAQKEMAAFQQTSTKARQNLQDIRSAVTGRQTPAQTEPPPP
jgi:tetratricopeptide (TPR) repeat protein